MNRIIRNFICFWYIVICLPSSCSKEAILKDDTMKEWFQQAFSVSGAGLHWTISGSNTFYETCGSGNYADFWFISNHVPLNFIGIFANLIYVNVETGKFELCANMGWEISENASKTCGDGGDADIWLISKHVTLYLNGTFIADLIYVDVETVEFELCARMGVRNSAPCYSNYFEVYIYRGQNEPIFLDTYDKPAVRQYLLSNFSPVYNITNNTSRTAVNGKNNQIFTFLQNKSEGVTFGIRSRGACGRIFRIKMYYYYCDETCIKRVTFPKTISPANGFKQVLGHCSINSTPSNNATNFNGSCSSDGIWFIPNTINCSCIQGYASGSHDCQCIQSVTTFASQTPSTTSTDASAEITVKTTTSNPKTDGKSSNQSDSSCYTEIIAIPVAIGTFVMGFLFGILVERTKTRKTETKTSTVELEEMPTSQINEGSDYAEVSEAVRPSGATDISSILSSFQNVKRSDNVFWEFPRSRVVMVKRLGEGSFGRVNKAQVTPIHAMTLGNGTVFAVKTLRESASLKDRRDFISELDLMKKLEPHAHVVQLLGCCTLSKPYLLIFEYLVGGALLGYLRTMKSRGYQDPYNTGEHIPTSRLSEKNLLSFAWMVSDGMVYLASKGIIHRDLAARNVLVGEHNICKVSDFDLAREGTYERKSMDRFAVKWTAPEDLFHGYCTSMSDVWSYGILLWEIFTMGDCPYPGVKCADVLRLVESGYRMPKQSHFSDILYSMMIDCLEDEPERRPQFSQISSFLQQMLIDSNSEVHLDLTKYQEHHYVNFDMMESGLR